MSVECGQYFISPLTSLQELKDVGHRDQMAAARGILQKNVPILYTASQACLQHPDVAAYKANRDLIYKQLQQAVSGISNAAQATASDDAAQQQGGGGELAYALNNFDVSWACCEIPPWLSWCAGFVRHSLLLLVLCMGLRGVC